ncbi:MAG: proline dehydrogenase [Acidobacteria bacterium]|nr:proline dehydrogenase [Acidobacteriota bacterium]
MISRTILLYLSRQFWLKDLLSAVPGFNRLPRRFIAGEEIRDAIGVIERLNRDGLIATFDHLGENTTSRAEAEADVAEYLRVLDLIAESGVRSNISIKLTQLGLDIDEEFCFQNVRQLVSAAAGYGNFVRIDMEDSTRTDATLRVFHRVYDEHRNVGIVLQACLRRTSDDLAAVIARGARVRLCKGAYYEPPAVAFQDKLEVDENYLQLMKTMLRSGIYHAFATHDERMISAVRTFAAKLGLSRDAFELQMLYGIRRDLQQQLVQDGYQVRVYVPYGRFWYPYFMRRLAERPANVWFVLSNLFRQ